jgi:hypothetical protein
LLHRIHYKKELTVKSLDKLMRAVGGREVAVTSRDRNELVYDQPVSQTADGEPVVVSAQRRQEVELLIAREDFVAACNAGKMGDAFGYKW